MANSDLGMAKASFTKIFMTCYLVWIRHQNYVFSSVCSRVGTSFTTVKTSKQDRKVIK